jgi:hypothetical protein
MTTQYRDELSGDLLTGEHVQDVAEFPLPRDNWYRRPGWAGDWPGCSELNAVRQEANYMNPAWGSAPRSLFVLFNDGGREGARWFPAVHDAEIYAPEHDTEAK